jgi:2'-5' RNA ligase
MLTVSMRTLYTLAYPLLPEADVTFMERFRREHDVPYCDVAAPHFTLIFGCSAVEEAKYLQHVQDVAKVSAAIRFSCRYAMLGTDDQDQTAYVFLVPDDGYSGISLLHDRLYIGVLAPYLRLDIPFIPHITIGTLADRHTAKQLCDGLNKRGLELHGCVNALTVGALENRKLNNLASFHLRT